jgi:hypothetical protein
VQTTMTIQPNGPEPSSVLGDTPRTPAVVRGRLTRADGRPVADITVRAYDKELRSEKLLGEDTTSQAGAYAITYARDQLSRPDKSHADLVVCAFEDGQEVAASAAIIDAPVEQAVDLVYGNEVYRGPAEYTSVRDAVMPYLGQADPAELTDEEIAYLAAKTGLDASLIGHLAAAERLARQIGLPSAVCYGLVRKGTPADRASLLRQGWQSAQRRLQTALDENLIPPEAVDLAQVTATLQQAAVAQAFAPPTTPGAFSLGELLATTALSRPQQESLVLRAVQREGTNAEFWAGLRADPAFGEAMVDDLLFSLYLGEITGYHVPLVRHLQQQRRSGGLASARDLARLDAAAWQDVLHIQQHGQIIGAPPNTPGATEEERIQAYAATLTCTFEQRYSTAALAGRLARAADPAQADLVRFMEHNQEFELGTAQIDTYLRGSDLNGITDVAQLSADLKGMQRIYRLVPAAQRLDGMAALLDAGLRSARSITRYSQRRFVKRFAASVGGAPVATQIYNNASQTAAAALAAHARYNSRQVAPFVIGETQNGSPDIPDWETLFGTLDYCACEHCASVYSPASYLVDLLGFLDQYEAQGQLPDDELLSLTALTILLRRRPDLAKIELTCANTDTLLPYVSLVLEVLENAIAGEWPAYQTRWSAAELSANDEHINAAAYDDDNLAGCVYPFEMPFNLWVVESRTFLEHLGVSLYQLMDTFQREPASIDGPNDDAWQAAIQRAGEYLRLAPLARRIISGDVAKSLEELWNLDVENVDELAAQLSDVPTFLTQAGTTYDELLELLYTRYVNPLRGKVIVDLPDLPGHGQPLPLEAPLPEEPIEQGIVISFSAPCTLEKATLIRLDAQALDRVHRFLRLQHTLAWTIRDLDRALTAVGDNTLDGVFLVRLMSVKQLLEQFGLPLDEQLSWWVPIPTTVYPQDVEQRSLYERLFLNNAVLNPVDDAFILNRGQTELAVIGLLSKHIPTIVAALEISAEDFDLLMDAGVTDDTLNLANLSQLYRSVSLTRALELSVAEFLSVSALTGIDPFERTQISQTLTFVDRVEQIRASTASIADLDYLLRHIYDPAAGIGLSQEAIRAALKTLQSGLIQIAQAHAPVADPTGAITASKLALLLTPRELPEAMAILAGTSRLERSQQVKFIEKNFKRFLDPAQAVPRLIPPPVAPPDTSQAAPPLGEPVHPWLSEPQERYEYVLGAALSYLGQVASWSLVTQQIAADLGLELAVAKALLTQHLPDSRARLLALRDADDPAVDQPACQAYLLLHKIALALSKLGAGLADLPWLFSPHDASGHAYAFGWYELSQLPLAPQATLDKETFSSWARLVSVFAFRAKFPLGELSLFDLLAAGYTSASANDMYDAIVAYTGWAREDVRTLAGPDAFAFVFPHDYKDERYLLQLDRAFALLGLIGMPAEVVITWKPTDDTDAMQVTAQSIKQAAKAKYDEATWLEIAPPLKDALREQQRAALVTYLVATRADIDRPSKLFEHYLIDAEMDACLDTSRIKQAISSVQLFVQRCLMGMEDGIELPPEAAAQWEWMKFYRVWEANRKIFLYPENWIEPELRDDKTPFFEDLSSELLQSELTADSAETAFRHYLAQLDMVDRIEVRSLYHELGTAVDDTPIDRLHVLARTPNAPYTYYYRQRVDAYWTAWEQVNVGVAGKHEFLAVHDGTLYLFMPELELIEERVEASNVWYEWDVTLQWSTYQHGHWTASKKAEHYIHIEGDTLESEKVFFFKTGFDGDNLLIIPLWDTNEEPFDGSYRQAFRMHCGEKVEFDDSPHDYWIERPRGTERKYMVLAESESEQVPLELSWSDATIGEVMDGVGEYWRPDEVEVLGNTSGSFELVLPHQYGYFALQDALFYHGVTRVFYAYPMWGYWRESEDWPFPVFGPAASGAQGWVGGAGSSIARSAATTSFRSDDPQFLQKKLRFATFHHPYVCDFTRRLSQGGVPALLQRETQSQTNDYFESLFVPNTDVVSSLYPIDEVEFAYDGAYTVYNAELFFHVPLLIAERLRQNQRFEEAQRWYHYILNPQAGANNGDPVPQRYWNYYPFYLETSGQTALDMMVALAEGNSDLAKQVEQWRKHPFQPHILARLRPQAYQKSVVMKYIQNLIDWGDLLFTQDTIETLNQATQLYILAANILGPRPEMLPATETDPMTFKALRDDLDPFGNALVELENYIAEPADTTTTTNGEVPPLRLYFGIPSNDELLALWDTMDDRLFKIRHCMNIEGIVRQLPLFEPPIDPGLLVLAVAIGVDLGSVLADLYAPLPHYRFQFMVQKAIECCNDVRSLGSALLAALASQDAEELALLRASHEKQVLESLQQIREKQVDEANQILESLQKARELSEVRQTHYQELLSSGLNVQEILNLSQLAMASTFQSKAQGYELEAAIHFTKLDLTLTATPDIPPQISTGKTFGGTAKGQKDRANAAAFQFLASAASSGANLASIMGGYGRRAQEWQHQVDLATKEIEQIDKQIAAAALRVAIAEHERDNLDQQIEHAQEVYDVMSGKYTNQELYSWTVSQISSIYFTSYQMAYDLAKRAESCYRHELGLTESSFIQFGYWDSLKKGLMAGEKLTHDLRQMEMDYLDQNKREYELTKHISLAMLDPIAVLMLKQNGECYFDLPEAIFDMDFPNHYMRRTKSISLSIPCVSGPYTSVSCTLTLLSNRIRQETGVEGGYAYTGLEDGRFQHNIGAIQSIATSSAQNDSGLFELNFRDERYLPFEGAGAVSSWRLELPRTFRQFDYDTISDVVLHVRYTARDGGAILREAVEEQLTTALNTMVLEEAERTGLDRLISLRQEFPTEWSRFLVAGGQLQTLTIRLTKQHFPRYLDYVWRDSGQTAITLNITSARLYLDPQGLLPDISGISINETKPQIDADTGLPVLDLGISGDIPAEGIDVTLTVDSEVLGAEEWKDAYILLNYSVKV